jgi:hypothetical protein
VTLQHPYLPVTATGLTTSVLPAQPGGRFSTQGFYPSPRGCQGVLGSLGTAQTDRIEATFDGSDCVLNPGPVGFTGSVTLTKDRLIVTFELPSAHERVNPARPSGSAPLRGRCARV